MQARPVVRALAVALALDTSTIAAPAGPPPARVVAQRHAAADSLVGFRLKDQFGRVHDAADYRGRPLLVVGAGRGGRAAATAWVQALRGMQAQDGAPADASALPVVAVADLRGVPRLLRRVVRGRFPDARDQAVLLDWDGGLARRLAFDRERCTIVVVGPTGLAHTQMTSTAVDSALARQLLRGATELAGGPTGRAPALVAATAARP